METKIDVTKASYCKVQARAISTNMYKNFKRIRDTHQDCRAKVGIFIHEKHPLMSISRRCEPIT